jgi:hypothetical protein
MIATYAYLFVLVLLLAGAAFGRGPVRGVLAATAGVLIVAGCAVGAYAISLGVTRVPAIHF